MAELHKLDASLAAQAAAGQQSLLETEQAKAALLVELQASGCGGASVPPAGEGRPFDVFTDSLEASSDELWASMGLAVSRSDVIALLRKLGTAVLSQPAGAGAPLGGASGRTPPLSSSTGPMAQPPSSGGVAASSASAPQAVVSLASVAPHAAANWDDGDGLPAVDGFDGDLLNEYMAMLDAHHSMDGHCDVAQQRQLAALLVTRATGGKRRLVQQQQGSA